MAKIKQPHPEFWESDKKPDYMSKSKRTIKKSGGDGFTHNVRFIKINQCKNGVNSG